MSGRGRVADYDSVAASYDRRYSVHDYAGVRNALVEFIAGAHSILEVGCGTGHWLAAIDRSLVAGVEPSSAMIARARAAAPGARLVRARAERLPWRDSRFDRVFCINALHHFSDRRQFFSEAKRVLKPGGAVMSVGKDPHAERDAWWIYDYFPATLQIDRDRFAPVRVLRGELALAGFAWAESFECDQIESMRSVEEAFERGLIDRAYTTQLTVLSEGEFQAGVARIRAANDAAGGALDLVTDFRLFATIGRV